MSLDANSSTYSGASMMGAMLADEGMVAHSLVPAREPGISAANATSTAAVVAAAATTATSEFVALPDLGLNLSATPSTLGSLTASNTTTTTTTWNAMSSLPSSPLDFASTIGTEILYNLTTAVAAAASNGTGLNVSGALSFTGGEDLGGTASSSDAPWWDKAGLNNGSAQGGGEDANVTYVITDWGDSIYPSGYSTLRLIVTAIFVTSLMIVIVVGNMLVIIAIVTEKALKTIQNWFIASLAVSDFLLGLIVMPFSLANELMGYWIFGTWWCDIHQAVDVLLCTASILNICMISLDRYWSITKAIEYLKQRTPARALVMICLVWVVSFVISVPPLLGWKKPYYPQDFPTCELSDDTGYVIYSALGSFYIPSVIMVFVYIRIYIAARSRARRNMKKKQVMDPAKDKSTTTTSFSNASPPDKNKNHNLPAKSGDKLTVPGGGGGGLTPSAPPSIASTPSPERRSEVPALEALAAKSMRQDSRDSDPDTPTTVNGGHIDPLLDEGGETGEGGGGGGTRENGSAKVVAITVPPKSPQPSTRGMYSAVPTSAPPGDDADCVSEMEHSSDSDQYRDTKASKVPLRRLRHLCRPPHKKSSKERREEVDLGKVAPKIRDPEREKRRIARKKERRATLILGLIMASFILSWLPFFMLYLLAGLCKSCEIPELAFGFAFWLGYCNSALNPIIYTIFNKDFRRAFRKILFK